MRVGLRLSEFREDTGVFFLSFFLIVGRIVNSHVLRCAWCFTPRLVYVLVIDGIMNRWILHALTVIVACLNELCLHEF